MPRSTWSVLLIFLRSPSTVFSNSDFSFVYSLPTLLCVTIPKNVSLNIETSSALGAYCNYLMALINYSA